MSENNNIFEISNADDYLCMIESYASLIPTLTIAVMEKSNMSNRFRLQFFPLEYFSGPTVWYGANFEIAPVEECPSVLAQLERYQNVPPEEMMEAPYNMNLYKVTTLQNTIKIVAVFAGRLQPGDKGVLGNL